jgi:hypothetical protein
MNTLTKVSAFALAALVASTSLAGAGPFIKFPIQVVDNGPHVDTNPPVFTFPQPEPRTPRIPIVDIRGHNDVQHNEVQLAVDCKVQSPLAVTDDIWIVNTGNTVLPSGITIKYRVPSTGDHGAFLLPRSIEVGDKLKISDLLHGAESGAPCTAKVLA